MRYFVSYFHKENNKLSLGNGFVTVDEPITTAKHIKDISLAISGEEGIILFFTEVPDPPTEENSHPE